MKKKEIREETERRKPTEKKETRNGNEKSQSEED
jgi:hypothetical protein